MIIKLSCNGETYFAFSLEEMDDMLEKCKARGMEADIVDVVDVNNGDELKVVTVRVPVAWLEAIDRLAMNNNMRRSDVIRMAIEKFLKEG